MFIKEVILQRHKIYCIFCLKLGQQECDREVSDYMPSWTKFAPVGKGHDDWSIYLVVQGNSVQVQETRTLMFSSISWDISINICPVSDGKRA